MALTSEDLSVISQLLDTKKSIVQSELQPIKDDIRDIKLHIENVTDKSIQLLTENYVPAAKRYESSSAKIESIQTDIEIMKKVITEHGEKFQKLA